MYHEDTLKIWTHANRYTSCVGAPHINSGVRRHRFPCRNNTRRIIPHPHPPHGHNENVSFHPNLERLTVAQVFWRLEYLTDVLEAPPPHISHFLSPRSFLARSIQPRFLVKLNGEGFRFIRVEENPPKSVRRVLTSDKYVVISSPCILGTPLKIFGCKCYFFFQVTNRQMCLQPSIKSNAFLQQRTECTCVWEGFTVKKKKTARKTAARQFYLRCWQQRKKVHFASVY